MYKNKIISEKKKKFIGNEPHLQDYIRFRVFKGIFIPD